MKYRITEIVLFSVSLVIEMEILSWELNKKQENKTKAKQNKNKKKTQKFLISYDKAILSL